MRNILNESEINWRAIPEPSISGPASWDDERRRLLFWRTIRNNVTAFECIVLELIAQGYGFRQAARLLGVRYQSVQTAVKRARQKLSVASLDIWEGITPSGMRLVQGNENEAHVAA